MVLTVLLVVPGTIFYPKGIVEYERLVTRLDGISLNMPVVLGYSQAMAHRDTRALELFIGTDAPVSSSHVFCPYIPPVKLIGAVTNVIKTWRAGPVIWMHTTRDRKFAAHVAAVAPKIIKVVTVQDRSDALRRIFRYWRNPPAALFLSYDVQELDPWVLREALRLQFGKSVAVVARTRHEALGGAAIAIEPQYDVALIRQKTNSGYTGPCVSSALVFYNPHAVRFLRIPLKLLKKLRARKLGR